MITFKQILSNTVVSTAEQEEFVRMCSDWVVFCARISYFDKVKVIKLMRYLIDDRPKSKQLLARVISRFNKLNMLKKEDLF